VPASGLDCARIRAAGPACPTRVLSCFHRRDRRNLFRLLSAAAVVIASGVLSPTPAHAGTYDVHSCRLPDGAIAGTSGWSGDAEGDVTVGNGCATGGSLFVGFGEGLQENERHWGSWGEWVFTSPPDTAIETFAIYRHVRVHQGTNPPRASEYRLYVDDLDPYSIVESCYPNSCTSKGTNPGVPRDSSNRVAADVNGAKRLALLMVCWRSDSEPGCPHWWEPSLFVYATDIRLKDDYPPEITSITGEGTSSNTLSGLQPVTTFAADRGGGLRTVALEIDGGTVLTERFGANTQSCEKPFQEPVPCVLSGSHTLHYDTRQLPDGPHQLRIILEDAAGNQTASEQYTIRTENAGLSCSHSSNGVRLRASFAGRGGSRGSVRIRAGRKATVRGRLSSHSQQAIGGATVRLFAQSAGQARLIETGTTRTNARGRFRLAVPPGPSRAIRIFYCEPGGSAVKDLRLKVAASTSFAASRRVLRNGESVMFRGRVRGGHVPRKGKLMEIQAFFRGKWRTFSTSRSDRDGNWRFKYKFGGTRGRITYRFRVLIPHEGGYPFETGRSRVIRVVVRGP
jgi:hypothetical protein